MRWLCTFVLCVGLAVSKNPEENEGIHDPDLYEGDMILTAQQRMAAELGLDVDAPFGRASIKNKRWPKGVMAYVIDSTLLINSRAMNAIKAGMQEWTSKTCIRFKPRTNEAAYAIFRIGKGCSSHVGRIGRSQNINLARGCWYKGIVAHEIGHALGFYHEQSRPDRDKYVTILWQNIEERAKHNFNKYGRQTIDSLGTKYDYGSVMHYGSKAFSKNKQPTIVAKQTGVAFGQRKAISITDAKQMNLLYSRCTDNGGSGGGGGGSCKDNPRYAKNCTFWKTRYCKSKRYESFMRANCSKSCGFCQ